MEKEKFKIGQEIYFMFSDEITSSEVVKIKTEETEHGVNTIYAALIHGSVFEFHESKCFSSKKNLIKSL